MLHKLGNNLWTWPLLVGAVSVAIFSAGVGVAVSTPPAPAPAEGIPSIQVVREAADPTEGFDEMIYLEGVARYEAEQAADRARVDAERAARDEAARQRRLLESRKRSSRSSTSSRPTAESASATGDVWAALARCESGGNPTARSANGLYFGAFQFATPTWRSLGYSGTAADHSYATQLEAAQRLQARSGWGQWPRCSRRLGLR